MSWLLDMRPRGAGGGGGAPLDATFITQTPSGTLTNEQALSLLATGLLKSTTGTGVVSIAVPTVDYASALQGALADSAVQPGDLAAVAFSGDYGDLLNLPTLGTMAAFNDAPSDGSTYGRNNGAWALVAAGVSPPFVDETAIVYKTGTPANTLTFNVDAYTAARTVAAPNADITLAGLEVANVFTAAQTVSKAADGTFFVIDGPGSPWSIKTVSGGNYLEISRDGALGIIVVGAGGFAGAPFTPSFSPEVLLDDTLGFRLVAGFTQKLAFYDRGSAIERFWVRGRFDPYGASATPQMYFKGNTLIETDLSTDLATFRSIDAVTNAVTDVVALDHNSSGIPDVNFGTALLFRGESSTAENQNMARIAATWQTATHASRKARSTWTVYDTAEREGLRIEASGTAPMLGVLGAAAVARQAHIIDPSGGGTQDAEARTAINAILVALENYGFLATS